MDFKYNLKNLSIEQMSLFYGFEDFNLKLIEKEFNCEIFANGEKLLVKTTSDNKDLIIKCLDSLQQLVKENKDLTNQEVIQNVDFINKKQEKFDNNVKFVTTYSGKVIRPKNKSQEQYYSLLENNTIVFAMGSAGTGKTYLAVALAAVAFKNKQVDKIILTRPAVEAGEKLGFLPGDLGAKVDPYLRPLFDALQEMFGLDTYAKLLERGAIEIAPLAYMRGRTLSNAFIILDEAQNTTKEQMKMFLTRMGEGSKIVVTGDVTQIDLPNKEVSGLVHATHILKDIDNISIIHLSSKDVVRSELVQAIVDAYSNNERESCQ